MQRGDRREFQTEKRLKALMATKIEALATEMTTQKRPGLLKMRSSYILIKREVLRIQFVVPNHQYHAAGMRLRRRTSVPKICSEGDLKLAFFSWSIWDII